VPSAKGGRPRKPEALKKLEGTQRPGRAPHKTAEAKGMPKRPQGLSAQAVRVWKALAPRLHALGLLAAVDASMFAAYCQAYADWLELTRYLNKLGPLHWYQTSESGYRQIIPEVTARKTAFTDMQRLGSRFGLDPSSRSGISIAPGDAVPDSSEEFLFGPRVVR
jgi:P27 family predicted phage terminase small subunit